MTALAIHPAAPARVPETRCIHDMLTFHTERGRLSTCSICRGMPYTIGSPLAEFDPMLSPDEPTTLQWLPAERRDVCCRCGSPIKVDQPAASLPGPAGTVRAVGSCCRDDID